MDHSGHKLLTTEIQRAIFLNTFLHSLDPKKRLTIPRQWREQIEPAKSVYVVPSVKGTYLNVFPEAVMHQILERIGNLSIADEDGRTFVRSIGSQSDLCPWDSQGRIRISDELLAYAQLENQVAFVGVIQSFEIWNPDLWAQERAKAKEPSKFGDAARRIGI
ncbi:MAG: hypothetical protein JXR37_09800 [Kiritimatiellae bacterium]|nr:hypothetical protein [Kiritimatiellia bacterium]